MLDISGLPLKAPFRWKGDTIRESRLSHTAFIPRPAGIAHIICGKAATFIPNSSFLIAHL